MLDRIEPELKTVSLDRDGVRLKHVEAGRDAPGKRPLVFVHGWIGDYPALGPQIAHFAKTRRVVGVALRGHGGSDAPMQEYTVAGFADDIAWQCRQLGLEKPVIVGHSFGGVITLDLAGRHPTLPSGIVMIDSIVFAPPVLRHAESVQQMVAGIEGPEYLAVARASAVDVCLDFNDPARKEAILDVICAAHPKTPQHVAYSTFVNSLDYDEIGRAHV